VTVEDNGIGFDQQHADRIFTIFTRLHTRFEYPGTGIGLAMCRRILDQYDGTITAQGEPDVGATFTIIIPVGGPS
ncbi:MAG: ATP-binding protein, partial [bacterium]